MSDWSHICCPVDFSEHSRAAFDRAIELAARPTPATLVKRASEDGHTPYVSYRCERRASRIGSWESVGHGLRPTMRMAQTAIPAGSMILARRKGMFGSTQAGAGRGWRAMFSVERSASGEATLPSQGVLDAFNTSWSRSGR